MIKTTMYKRLAALGLLTMALGLGTVFAQTVPLITFGPAAPGSKGDDDFREQVRLRIPKTVTQRLYLRVFDPDVGGTEDEPTGPWNTHTRFSLLGAGGTELLKSVFGEDGATDGQWHTLGNFMPEQGDAANGDYLFIFQAEGLEGNDGNLFDLFVSSDPEVNRPVPGALISSDRPTFSVTPGFDQVAEVRFVVPAGTVELVIRNFDLDRARAVLQLPFVEPIPLSDSADGGWREDRISIEPGAKDRVGAVTVRGGRTLRNNLVLEFRDGEGAPLAARLPVRAFPRGSPPHPAVEHEIHADCRTVLFDAGGSSDAEDSLSDYLWDFGDGQTGSGKRVRHLYEEPGTYRVVLTVIEDSERVADRSRLAFPVKVNQAPEAVSGPRQVVAPGERVQFDAGGSRDADGEIVSYLWNFGDGHRGTGRQVFNTYAEPGVYSVSLRVEDDGPGPCRSAEAVSEVWVNAQPTAVAGIDRGAAVGEILTFDAGGSFDVDGVLELYRWDLGDGHGASGPSVEHAYAVPGRYLVTLTVEDDAAIRNSRAVDQLTVTVNDPPLAALVGDARGAVDETLTFAATGSRDSDGSIIEHAWDFGDGHQAVGDQVTHAYGEPGRYLVTLVVRDDSGTGSDTGSVQHSVVVNDPPVADAGDDQHLTASEVRFDASASHDPDGEIKSWSWDFGDGTAMGQGPQPTHVYAAPGRYRVVLTVTDDSGTISDSTVDSMEVIVNARPEADAGPDRRAATKQILAFDASGSFDPDGTVDGFSWDFGDGSTGDGIITEHAYEMPGLYNVRLQVRDDTGHPEAVGFADALVRVNAPPIAIAGPDVLVAPGQVVELDAGASRDLDGEISAYRWTFSDGHVMTEGPRVSRSFSEPGSLTADLEVIDDSGVANGRHRDRLAIRVNHPPSAVPGQRIHSCSPWVELDGSASRDADGDRLDFIWAFGDGDVPARGEQVSHRFPQAGHYPVVLTVDDRTGLDNATHNASTDVWVHSAPVAKAEGPALACAGEVILFNGENSYDPDGGRLLYHWDFGDGSEARTSSPVKSYEHPGAYKVSLRVEDDSELSCNSDLDQIAVVVADAPVAEAGEDRTLCANTPIIFDGSGSRDFDGVVNSYSWDFGDGTQGGGPNPTHVFTQAGDYRVTLTVTGDQVGDCANHHSDEVQVRVLAAPGVVVEAPARAIQGDRIVFNAALPDGARLAERLTYTWEFGDGNSAAGQSVEHSFGEAGRYRVALNVLDPSGGECSGITVEHAMLVNAPPIAVAGQDRVTAPGEIMVFDGSGSSDPDGAISGFEWDFGDGEKAEGARVPHRYDGAGVYVTTLTVTDDSGLEGGKHRDSVAVMVNNSPIPQLELKPEVPCRGEDLVLDATGSSDPDGTLTAWSWDLGDGVAARGAEVQHNYDQPGRYTVTLAIEDDAGAPNSNIRLVREIRVNHPPSAIMTAPTQGCPGKPIDFDASRSQGWGGQSLEYRWTFGDDGEAFGAQATHVYEAAGHYKVTLEVTDTLGSSCSTTQETVGVLINAAPQARIEIPSKPFLIGGAHDGVLFDASGSTDPEGGSLTYHWDFGDGTQGRGPKVIHDYAKPGRYQVKLEVRDGSDSECDTGMDQLEIDIRERK